MHHVSMLFLLLITFILIGVPIYIAMAFSSIIMLFVLDIPLSVLAVRLFGGIDSFTLMAIPFFILAGNIMVEAKITDKVVEFADSLVGRFKGGLGHVNILSSMIFAGIQGSGVADASAVGSIMIPSMIKQGYEKDYAVAVTASSATIGPIIPPSIAMIMYGYYTQLSVARLFLGGLLPGILVGIGLMIVNGIVFRKRNYNFERTHYDLKGVIIKFFQSIGALTMPLIIILGIVTGVFTPTESGIAATVYGLFYGLVITRQLKVRRLPRVIVKSANTTAIVMIVLSVAGVFSQILTRLRFQRIIIDQVLLTFPNKYMATIAIMLVLIILGLFIDPSVLIVMFGATVSSAGILLGFDPIHFGIVMVIAMMMGAVTPPVGSMLYISCSIARIPIEKSIRVLLPFISVLFFVAFAVLFVPGMVTWINVLVFR